jgi:hypothetical protein
VTAEGLNLRGSIPGAASDSSDAGRLDDELVVEPRFAKTLRNRRRSARSVVEPARSWQTQWELAALHRRLRLLRGARPMGACSYRGDRWVAKVLRGS